MAKSSDNLMAWRLDAAKLTQLAVPLRRALRHVVDRRGVTASEYAILAVAVVIVVGIAATQLLDPTRGAYVYLANVLGQTQNDVYSGVSGTR